jgi:hypothetical protein
MWLKPLFVRATWLPREDRLRSEYGLPKEETADEFDHHTNAKRNRTRIN